MSLTVTKILLTFLIGGGLTGCIQLYVLPADDNPPVSQRDITISTQASTSVSPSSPPSDVNVTVTNPSVPSPSLKPAPSPPSDTPQSRPDCPIYTQPQFSPVPPKPTLERGVIDTPEEIEAELVHYINQLRGYIQARSDKLQTHYNIYIEDCE